MDIKVDHIYSAPDGEKDLVYVLHFVVIQCHLVLQC